MHEFPISNGTKVLQRDHQRRTRIAVTRKMRGTSKQATIRLVLLSTASALCSNFISFNIITRTVCHEHTIHIRELRACVGLNCRRARTNAFYCVSLICNHIISYVLYTKDKVSKISSVTALLLIKKLKNVFLNYY